jgi:hypothetical protein
MCRNLGHKRTKGHGTVSNPGTILRTFIFFALFAFASSVAHAQGGPPFFSNDPGTPGNLNWEMNFAYLPFLFTNQSLIHTPDVDINFGLGNRLQLTYEGAWLRVHNPGQPVKFGVSQDQLGVKWRFHDGGESGIKICMFPQVSLNNPNDSVARGITPRGASLLLPVEFAKKFGPVNLSWEVGYNLVHRGPDEWTAGLVAGHDFTKKLELDAEFFNLGTYHSSEWQPTLDVGARYRLHKPFILLLMAGRSARPASSTQAYLVGYFGVQILLPPKSYDTQ